MATHWSLRYTGLQVKHNFYLIDEVEDNYSNNEEEEEGQHEEEQEEQEQQTQ